MFLISSSVTSTYPTAHAGFLVVRGAANPSQSAALEEQRLTLEQRLRQQYAGQDRASLANEPVLQAYKAYYRRFDKTYHVQLQLESVVFKGKSIPSGSGLVQAMFMAELNNLLLTAGHDLEKISQPIVMDVATGEDSYRVMRGQEQRTKTGDMVMRDAVGILSSIIYGPDEHSQITPATRNVVYTVYGVPGVPVDKLQAHLENLHQYVLLAAPAARCEQHLLGL